MGRHNAPDVILLCIRWYCRSVDSAGNTVESMLSAKRDGSAVKRFLKKTMRAEHRSLPFTIGTDKYASYPEAFAALVKEKVLLLTASCGW